MQAKLPPEKLKKLKKMAEILDKGEIGVLEYLYEIEEKIDAEIKKIEKKLPALENVIEHVKGLPGDKGEPGKDGENYILTEEDKKEIASKITVPVVEKVVEKIIEKTEVVKEIPIVTENRITEIKEVAVLDVDLLPQYGEKFRDGLELIDGEDNKLKIEAIGHLREELDALKKEPASGGNGLTFREMITKYDLSPYLDGVTKTFNIPGTYAILSVACSSFPSVLRPEIDYTHTQSTITFTSEIEASTTLALGQTVIITLINA